jgi:glycosyltransferase involved in cell wall biosynthesis
MSTALCMTEMAEVDTTMTDKPSRERPRLVMIVDNRVDGDSRVIKSAVTAASAGWDTVVIGRSYGALPEESHLVGGARVLRVPVVLDRAVFVRNKPRRGLSAAFAFPHQAAFDHAVRMQRGLAADQKAQILGLKQRLSEQSGAVGLTTRVRLTAIRVRSVMRRRLFRFRAAQFARATRKARSPDGPYYALRARLWRRVAPRSFWRSVEPLHLDYEMAYGPVVDDLEPDVIHAHDFRAIGVAVRAKWRAQAAGREVAVVYDAHEHVPGLVRDREFALSNDAYVREYIHDVDAVTTVSERLAEVLRAHYGLETLPRVVINTPLRHVPDVWPKPSVRARVGLPDDVALIVHSGSTAPERGIGLVVKALVHIPELHFVIVTGARNRLLQDYLDLADALGVADRVHVARYVPNTDVSTYLSSATLACIPVNSHAMNNNVAAPTKFYEYLHAHLPIVVSDARIISEQVTKLGIGEVFAYDRPDTLVAAIRTVLADLPAYRAKVEAADEARQGFSWENQATVFLDVWRDVNRSMLPLLPRGEPARSTRGLLIGRVNSAGQASAWARAVARSYPVTSAQSFAIEKPGAFAHGADILIPATEFSDSEWQPRFLAEIRNRHSHVLVESLHALLPELAAGVEGGLGLLERNQFRVGLIFHGSDIRDPEIHEKLNPGSPFPRLRDAGQTHFVDTLARNARLRRDVAEWFGDPIFVSTPDLIDYVDRAWWLPVTVEMSRWATSGPVLNRRRPVVLHAPSNELLKGSDVIDRVLRKLAEEDVVDYVRAPRVPADDMPALVATSDVVVDQLHLGLYGVLACEAMAARRLVVSEVGDRVRARVPVDIPIVEVDEYSLEATLRRIASEPARFRDVAEAGPGFVRRFHDGTLSARILGRWIGVATPAEVEALAKEDLCRT